ncbi:MAG: sodium:proton antiporter [Candidatus Omnitrophota bacterium]
MTPAMLRDLMWALPFAGLLLSIAIFPLWKPHAWEKYYPYVSILLGLSVVLHYIFGLKQTEILLETGQEYLSFIILIGSLFVVSGGIFLQTRGEATPARNCIFLFVASCFANLLGTTGASMVFIRPWIRMNKYRFTGFHLVFFIFLVSNIAGGLTPIGDPPLFLGYLKGVPFFWVLFHVWPMWLIAMAYLLVLFFVIDTINFRKAPRAIRDLETAHDQTFKFRGKRNILYLAMILGSVFINHPPFLREGLMLIAAALSLWTTPRDVHEANDFNFKPIREVAILFLGIFATMIPALEWLEHYARELGIQRPGQFFWLSGALSSVLDNAPTYLNFLSLQCGLFMGEAATHMRLDSLPAESVVPWILSFHPVFLTAISVSTVFFGAMTYIGNGPNFLVKSIAEHAKVKTPGFFGYLVRYGLPILLPLFVVLWWLFFR